MKFIKVFALANFGLLLLQTHAVDAAQMSIDQHGAVLPLLPICQTAFSGPDGKSLLSENYKQKHDTYRQDKVKKQQEQAVRLFNHGIECEVQRRQEEAIKAYWEAITLGCPEAQLRLQTLCLALQLRELEKQGIGVILGSSL